MNYQELNGKTIREGFNEFNKENPHIYAAFEEQALKAINKGREKISAKLIINWIRWNEYRDTTDVNFKINDAYQAYYAREFVRLNPQYCDVFAMRRLRNEENGPYMTDESGQISFT
tara:strand:+ start:266 stop:613 length:348 start_codon:yes stop_codon:yes gene_type:complete